MQGGHKSLAAKDGLIIVKACETAASRLYKGVYDDVSIRKQQENSCAYEACRYEIFCRLIGSHRPSPYAILILKRWLR